MKRLFLIITLSLLFAQIDRVKVQGDYSYTFGDSETLLEAKNICYSMAIREAIESHSTFISSTSTVTHTALNDLIQTLSSGYLEEITIIEEKIDGRNVYYKVEAFVQPELVKKTINREIKRIKNNGEYNSIVENGNIKVISVKKRFSNDGSQKVFVAYKQKIAYKPTEIMIDWNDSDGIPFEGDKAYTEKRLRKGEIRSLSFYIPSGAISYRVWLKE
jgi:hypothetical protein|tara:strand:- start:586 stop:1236 length:651 start_codon:yes stop_codon:yes gene_type:complete